MCISVNQLDETSLFFYDTVTKTFDTISIFLETKLQNIEEIFANISNTPSFTSNSTRNLTKMMVKQTLRDILHQFKRNICFF